MANWHVCCLTMAGLDKYLSNNVWNLVYRVLALFHLCGVFLSTPDLLNTKELLQSNKTI